MTLSDPACIVYFSNQRQTWIVINGRIILAFHRIFWRANQLFLLSDKHCSGCNWRERTFRNDIKQKGRKGFFKPRSTEACCRFPGGGVRIVSSLKKQEIV